MAQRKKSQTVVKKAARAAATEFGRRSTRSVRSFGVTLPVILIGALFVAAFIYGSVLENQGVDTQPPAVIQNFIEKDADLTVYYIDVGQGDCSLIRYNGINILTDAGEKEYGGTVVSFLQDHGVEKLDYVIATHPHSDHIGGMAEVIGSFDIGKVIAPKISEELTPTSGSYERFLKALSKKGLKLTAAKPGTVYSLAPEKTSESDDNADNTAIEILAPLSSDYEDLNNFSVVFKLTHGKTAFLFTGDAEKESENDILASGADISADVLKVGHHGSSSSTKKDFLNAVLPSYAVIQCGKDNSYNHPNEKTVERLEKMSVKIFRNDNDGTVTVYSDGSEIRAVKESEEKK